jgi:cell division protein FtsB
MIDPQITRNIDLRNVGKGLIIGLSMLYGANSATDYAISQIEKRLDTQRAYFLDQFKEVKRDTHEQITREVDILRAEVRELRDHEARRAVHEG